MTRPLLVVTAVAAERDAVRAGLPWPPPVTVAAVGVGAATAAAGTARLLTLAEAAGHGYRGVVSAGIAGGFPGRVPVGGVVLARRSVHADLGAQSADGFLSLDELGLGTAVMAADDALLDRLARGLAAVAGDGPAIGDVLTVTTVTGTADRAAALAQAHPEAVAEAMEGYGVACAAAAAGVAFAEVRTISNPVGPRERSAWRIGDALAALTRVAPALAAPS